MELESLSTETKSYINKTDIKHRKSLGQYFTPRKLREELVNKLPKLYKPLVCEPSAGTGEFISSVLDYFVEPEIEAYEIDKDLASLINSMYPQVQVNCTNTLLEVVENKYDLVVGNPPFFQIKLTKKLRELYSEVIKGRVNIYTLFIKWALDAVKPGGYVAFVVPSSMNSGAYFEKLRKYITTVATVEFIKLFDSNLFNGASQNVQVLVLRKKQQDFIFDCGITSVFTPFKTKLSDLYSGSYSINDLGYKVSTGKIVWNQNKGILSEKSGVLLIWAHNIRNGEITLSNIKPQYIRMPELEANKGPAIVVNRIVGCGAAAKIRTALVDGIWVAENHVNVIEEKPQDEQFVTLEHLKKELESDRVAEVIKKLSGNTQLSKKELEFMIPIRIPNK